MISLSYAACSALTLLNYDRLIMLACLSSTPGHPWDFNTMVSLLPFRPVLRRTATWQPKHSVAYFEVSWHAWRQGQGAAVTMSTTEPDGVW